MSTHTLNYKIAQGGVGGNQQLGMHVTADELAIWQTRRTDNSGNINGVTYQTMYNNVIQSKADSFKATPTTATWNPTTGEFGAWSAATEFPDNTGGGNNTYSPGGSGCCDAGGVDKVTAAAFVYMLTGDSSYGDPVRTWLLNHAGYTRLDFSNHTAWPISGTSNHLGYDGVLIRCGKWLVHALFAYDYLRIGGGILSGGDRTTIETWLNNAGQWCLSKINSAPYQNAFPSRPTYTSCSGGTNSQCGSAQNGTLYDGGPATTWLTETWSNRQGCALIYCAAAAAVVDPVITWDASYASAVKMYIKEFLMFSTWSTSTCHETYRWSDGGGAALAIGSSWSHGTFQWGSAMVAADHIARTGDDELYTYSTTAGLDGMSGVNVVITGQTGTAKSLLSVAQRYADMASGAVKVYINSTHTDTNWIHPDAGAGEGLHGEDTCTAMNNLYWNDTKVKNNYLNRGAATDHSGLNTWGGPWGVMPHVLFMYGNLEGVVWPY